MKYTLEVPSLEQTAGVKIISALWNRDDIKNEIARFNFSRTYCFAKELGAWGAEKDELKFKSIETSIEEKVRTLEKFPAILQKRHAHLIRPLGLEMIKWWFLHRDFVSRLPHQFFWTGRGTADDRKIAAVLVKDENEAVETRYKMACTYCLENEVRVLWERVPETRKPLFYNNYMKEDECLDRIGWVCWNPISYRADFVAFWTYIINDKANEMYERVVRRFTKKISHPQLGFVLAARGLNPSAMEFFLEQLSSEDHRQLLPVCAQYTLMPKLYHIYKTETLFFMLRRLSDEEQEFLFTYHSCDALECMLIFPYQTYFLATAKKWFRFVPKDTWQYTSLFNAIRYKISKGEEDYDYRQVFREFWLLASIHDGDFFRMNFILSNVIKLYSDQEADREMVEDVVRRTTEEQKKTLLYLKRNDHSQYPLVVERKLWACLRFLLEECKSQQIVVDFKKLMELHRSREEDAELNVQ